MDATNSPETAEMPLSRPATLGLRDWLRAWLSRPGGRWTLIVLTVVAIGAGLTLNWGWLVAAGVAPILLTAGPCLAMCALGLCARGMGGKSCEGAAGKPAGQRTAEDRHSLAADNNPGRAGSVPGDQA